MSLGPHHSAALTQKGEVYTWGQAGWRFCLDFLGILSGFFGWFLEGSKETMLSDFGHFGSFSQAGRLGHASQGAEVDDAGL